MVFKRRDRRPIGQLVLRWLWPQGGWARSYHYVRLRLRRLPGSPESIARGAACGVFISFTPFFGLHFLMSAFMAWLIRGSIVAALLGTFFGNPLTYVPIGVISLQTGHFILGTQFVAGSETTMGGKFLDASSDLAANTIALFTNDTADWQGLAAFYYAVFQPYLIGSLAPGLVAGLLSYWLMVPVIRAYQKRRAGRMKRALKAFRQKVRAHGGRKQGTGAKPASATHKNIQKNTGIANAAPVCQEGKGKTGGTAPPLRRGKND
ncbi:MAG: DUF2062 domain-containing protein [Rhodobacteraceae bacterium]|nr:DUF2062 domain-containing protein [Paracoccaceae bacterium]